MTSLPGFFDHWYICSNHWIKIVLRWQGSKRQFLYRLLRFITEHLCQIPIKKLLIKFNLYCWKVIFGINIFALLLLNDPMTKIKQKHSFIIFVGSTLTSGGSKIMKNFDLLLHILKISKLKVFQIKNLIYYKTYAIFFY